MLPLEDNNDEVRQRLAIRRPDSVWLIVRDARPAHPAPKTGAFATDGNNPDMTTEVV